MSIRSALSKVVSAPARKIINGMIGGFVGRWAQSVANGEKGPLAQRIYLTTRGWKTWTGLALTSVAAGLAAVGTTGSASAGEWVTGTLGMLLISAGLADKEYQKELPESVKTLRLYVWMRDHAAGTGSLFALAGTAVMTCSADTALMLSAVHYGSWVLTCAQAKAALWFTGGVFVQLGWMAEARLTPAPPK